MTDCVQAMVSGGKTALANRPTSVTFENWLGANCPCITSRFGDPGGIQPDQKAIYVLVGSTFQHHPPSLPISPSSSLRSLFISLPPVPLVYPLFSPPPLLGHTVRTSMSI
uniref:Uncharacterized protein n=1 Tax=Eutreptiella gymnastica TaxID=73025 RepID=A0A7S1N8Q5_9EUGL|mmetsp:Transcript_138142/g.240160  ORF Transcript_138142/g.240160 Transcript_138142/m.240160 type:complete len:110 (+) Transcript_138142:420-749(+)